MTDKPVLEIHMTNTTQDEGEKKNDDALKTAGESSESKERDGWAERWWFYPVILLILHGGTNLYNGRGLFEPLWKPSKPTPQPVRYIQPKFQGFSPQFFESSHQSKQGK